MYRGSYVAGENSQFLSSKALKRLGTGSQLTLIGLEVL